MSLTAGTSLGHYNVTSLLGQGGMGQVWQATDTQLNRQVALKILPDAFADDPDRLARFTREAQILASLNHPNIAAIHGIEESEGTRALVLELVEGPTLADRISHGPIPLDEALPIAKQIAEALEAAHEAGVIHRDLKPANIKVREDGTVKVLDFGLAKALDPNPAGDPSQSPTLTAAATQMGVIMGTAAYMSPEQAKGKPIDKRTDVWAYGAVVFEMLTGRRAFPGEDLADTTAAVVRGEPAWDSSPPDVPPRVMHVLRACLAKDRTQRARDIGDVTLALEGRFEEATVRPRPGTRQPARWQHGLPWVAALLLAVITGLAVRGLSQPPPVLPTHLTVVPPAGVQVGRGVTLSSDGRTLAFVGTSDGMAQIYLRSLDQREAVPLRGSQGTLPLGFSPDGHELLVADVGRNPTVKRIPLTGGPATEITQGQSGADWGPDDTVVLGAIGSGLRLVRAPGGETTSLTTLAEGEGAHIGPRFLPGGRSDGSGHSPGRRSMPRQADGFFMWSAKAAPCGSMHCAMMSPPGTSIGPLSTCPPSRFTCSTFACTSETVT